MENKINIVRHQFETVDLYSPVGELIGTLNNDIEVTHIQLQIAQQGLEGYYLIWKDKKITLNRRGELDQWPVGMYDHIQHLFAKMFNARKEKVS